MTLMHVRSLANCLEDDNVVRYFCHHSSSSRMRVIYHNWSATKQRPHPQSVAEISHHSVLSGDRIRQFTIHLLMTVLCFADADSCFSVVRDCNASAEC